MGTQQVSAGAAVITPQHRLYRVPQGSPQVFGGPWGSIFKPPRPHRAGCATIRVTETLIAPKQLVNHLLAAPSSRRPALAHARVMYLFCRVFSCQRSAKEKLLLDSHDKNRRFVLSVLRFIWKKYFALSLHRSCGQRKLLTSTI